MIWFLSALFCFCLWCYHFYEAQNIYHLTSFSDALILTKEELPTLTIVIAARDEGKTIRPALESLLAVTYPHLEVVVVNDRSRDDTKNILDEFSKKDARLKIKHISKLTPGWLGKTNALHQGAQQVASKWILFTDADVHFTPTALIKAVSIAETSGIDHLAVLPRLEEHSPLLGITLGTTLGIFIMFMKPWKVRTAPTYYAGAGAFNLIKTEFYHKHGGHSKIAMRPDDDMMLGKLVKICNGQSDLALSNGEVHLSWYETLDSLIHGLTKNTYASLDYSIIRTIVAVMIHFIMYILPVLGVYKTEGFAQIFFGASIFFNWWVSYKVARATRASVEYALFTPVGAVILIYILVRTVVVTHYHGGIFWRDTFYSLANLKKNVI